MRKTTTIPKDDEKKLEVYGAYGVTMEEIARSYKLSRRGFYKLIDREPWVKEAIDRGKIQANAKVAESAYKMATSGECPTMTIFWLKTRNRWKEPAKEILIAPWQKRYGIEDPEKLEDHQLLDLLEEAKEIFGTQINQNLLTEAPE